VHEEIVEFLDSAAKSGKPFFISLNFMKLHQPNLPHPDFIDKSPSKSKFADSIVEADTRIGQAGNRVPAIAWWPGKIKAGSRNYDIVGGLDLMATFASLGGVKLPKNDREGKPCIFDSYDITPVLFGTGPDPRTTWFYFTEDELSPGAIRWHNYKFVFNLRGDPICREIRNMGTGSNFRVNQGFWTGRVRFRASSTILRSGSDNLSGYFRLLNSARVSSYFP
jgi:arylsulfatase